MFLATLSIISVLEIEEKRAAYVLLMNHYINYCQITILHIQTEMDSLVHELADHPTPAFLENLLRVMKHIVQQWQAEFEWVRSVREQELEQLETPRSSAPQEGFQKKPGVE